MIKDHTFPPPFLAPFPKNKLPFTNVGNQIPKIKAYHPLAGERVSCQILSNPDRKQFETGTRNVEFRSQVSESGGVKFQTGKNWTLHWQSLSISGGDNLL